MTRLSDRVINDLTKTAVERTRATAHLVTQLLDDDVDIAGVLLAVAADMIVGSTLHLHQGDDELTEDEALGYVLKALFGALGSNKVKAAILATPNKKKRKAQAK